MEPGRRGWANAYYSAAAQAGASDWTAMLFGSSDAANAITVDKTPAAWSFPRSPRPTWWPDRGGWGGWLAVTAAVFCCPATASTPHSGAIPSVGPSQGGGPGGGFGGGLLSAPSPHPDLTRLLTIDADQYDWAAAVVGSNNTAGYQLFVGVPVMAVGGFNGTDPSPTLAQFIRYVDDKRLHYFIEGRMMRGRGGGEGGTETAAITEWVKGRFPGQTVEGSSCTT